MSRAEKIKIQLETHPEAQYEDMSNILKIPFIIHFIFFQLYLLFRTM